MSISPAIELSGVTRSYGEHQVLRDVTLTVPAGSIYALLGSNGAGKTTTVRILSILLRPDGGTATVHGYDVTTHPEQVRASISLTGQFAAVDEVLTGRENLLLVARLRRVLGPGWVADDLLVRFDLVAGLRELYLAMADVGDCAPDDPRLPELAARVAAFVEAATAAGEAAVANGEAQPGTVSPELVALLDEDIHRA